MVRRAFVLLVLACGLLGCSAKDPVQALLDDLVAAAEDRDADGIGELLAADFRAEDGAADKASAVTTAKQYLFAYRALDIGITKLEVNRRGDSARATFRLVLTGTPSSFGGIGDLVPRKAVYDFDVSARDDGGTWRLSSASWKDAGE